MILKDLVKRYQNVYMKTNLKPNTYRGYLVNLEKHILPVLGDRDTDSLADSDIDLLVSEMAEKGLGNTTIQYALKTLKQALHYGVRHKYITYNAMDSYDMPKKSEFEYTTLTADQERELLHYLLSKDSDSFLCVMLCGHYGLRRGEALGLKYTDLNGTVLSVRRTSNYVNGSFQTTGCKTAKSRRDIALLPEDAERITAYHLNREEDRDGFLMRNHDGKHQYQRDFKLALNALNLPNVRIHDLRHSYATLMMREGVNPKIVSTVLGHSGIDITMDLYSHADISMQKECLHVLEQCFHESESDEPLPSEL